ncbi:MAG TPA: FG-GAP-like repeat-containing protein [Pyrinomonadaceae bacterium]|nr:FG-GAP-like repeat-containing protein [Pyrinomonadaceae bacterium]
MQRTIAIFIISAVLILLLGLQVLAGQAGRLDPTFGTGGTALHENVGGGAMALQADGKIVLAGSAGNQFALFRLNADGTLDTSFGINGMVRTTIVAANNLGSSARDLIIQPDGKIIAVGQVERGNFIPPNTFSLIEVALVRYNQDGSLDTSFGGDGMVTTLIDESSSGTAVELQADGKIVVAEFFKFAVIRYNADGSLDTTFGANGVARTNFGSGYSRAMDLKIQTDGKIVIAGYDNPVSQVFIAVARYNTNGTLDTGFDGDGKLTASIAGEDRAYGLVIQPDGKMLVVCTAQTGFGELQHLGLARFLPNGAFDTTFGSGGKVIAPANFGSATDIALQADGKIITAGLTNWVFSTSNSDFTVARFLPNGSPDTSFDGDGLAIINLFTGDRANAVAIQPDGKIVATGGSGGYFLAARFHSKPDTFADFDGDGKTDVSIFRPSNGQWWIKRSSDSSHYVLQFGLSTDKIVPADYTGDGKTDVAIYRPSTGDWFILRSENFTYYAFPFGISEDVPVPGDFDGDGKADPTVFRRSTAVWYINNSSNGSTTTRSFGIANDLPVVADYDGDGKSDIAVYRLNASEWWISQSSNGAVYALDFGTNFGGILMPGDYTGDGKADFVFYQLGLNGYWFVRRSEDYSDVSVLATTNTFGNDVPVGGDFDGDGILDFTIFRAFSSSWHIRGSTGAWLYSVFGTNGDIPIQNAYFRYAWGGGARTNSDIKFSVK